MTKNTPRIFISLLLMLLCIGILPVSAFASGGDYPDDTLPTAESSAADTQETKQIGTVTTNGGNLNVRTGAGLDNTAFTQLPNGTVVDVIGRDGDWVKILLPARVGYVYGSYLTVTDAADSTVSIGGITLPFDEKELADLWQLLLGSMTGGSDALTPDGNLTLIDDIGSSTKAGKQFINHQASEQMLGYLYQVRYALALLLENDNSDCQISIEKFDDVAFSKDDIPISFNELEAYAYGTKSATPEQVAVKAYARKKQSGSVTEIVPEGTPTEVVEHRLSEEELICSACGSKMEEIGKEVRRSLQMEPARFWIREDVYYTYACRKCEQDSGEANILKTPKEPALLPGSYASAEAVAHIAVQKFVMYSPLYRLEQEFHRQGLKLSRQTMSNWLLNVSDTWLQPIYEVLHRQLCREKVLHGDETTLQVLKEPGKAATSKSYMWLYRTSGCTEHPIVLYEYQPNRKAEHAEEFLKGFSGWLHADGYHGYHRLPENIRVVGCWAHARRKFDEALQTLPQEKRKDSLAAAGECYCSRLFQLEKSFTELTPEERHAKRLEQEKPVLDALLAWANAASGKAAPKSALGRALHYLLEQWPYLIRYLEDGRLELSNNRAERSIKPFVMGRKNWLFANTPGGAQSSSVIYSLIETAKENGLDPYRYLLWVLRNAPAMSQMDEAWAEQLLPASAPQECRIPKE